MGTASLHHLQLFFSCEERIFSDILGFRAHPLPILILSSLSFLAVLQLKLRAYTLSHPVSLFFVMGFLQDRVS
jgi:hypothetical protein